jgi:group II intron reverse transcriptase/maturase
MQRQTPEDKIPNMVQQYGIRLLSTPNWPACTQWQDWMKQIRKIEDAHKDLKHSASVSYPEDLGNNGKLPLLNNIGHHFTVERVRAAALLLNSEAVAGIDGRTLDDWMNQASLEELVHEVRSRRYRPQSNRWVSIPKPDGKLRTLGIPCVADRVAQRTWLLIVEPAFERVFLDCSYGYRPDRNCHQALSGIAQEIATRGSVWVLDADFKAYFDSVPHNHLMSFIQSHINDPVFLTFCARTLEASRHKDMEQDGIPKGVPQGGVASPLFANLFAHVVLDVFFESDILPRLNGWARLFRYADDFVVLTEREEDAELAHQMVKQRVEQFGLMLHPDKTAIRNMTCPERQARMDETDLRELVFLGYELSWQQSARNKWELVGRTAPGRREKSLEKWKKLLKQLEGEMQQYKRNHRGEASLELIHKLEFSAIAHVNGFAAYYCAEGNQTEVILYELSVLRSASAFWRRHIDSRGSNPFENDLFRIWPRLKWRNVCELSKD